MLRRDSQGDWLLISQVDHAHLAAEIAVVWEHGSLASLPLREEFLAAVRHHDDGWREWEASPQIDPHTARPRNFTEMPLEDSAAIWSRSIESGLQQGGPFAAIWISRHFRWLGERSLESPRETGESRAMSEFLATQQSLEVDWLLAAGELVPEETVAELAHTGFRWLQFFDLVSLWLCTAERTRPETLTDPDGVPVTFTPENAQQITLDPYPLAVPQLALSVPARRIASRPYANDADLQETLQSASGETLCWALGASF